MAKIGVVGVGVVFIVILIALAMMALVQPAVDATKAVVQQAPQVAEIRAPAPVKDKLMTEGLKDVQVDPNYSHGDSDHPIEASVVRKCLNEKGSYLTFQVSRRERFIRVCLIDDKTIGFQLVDYVGKVMKERTAYVQIGIHSIQELLDYGARKGYPVLLP